MGEMSYNPRNFGMEPGVHAYHPNTGEVEAGGSRVKGQLQLCDKFEMLFKIKPNQNKTKFMLMLGLAVRPVGPAGCGLE